MANQKRRDQISAAALALFDERGYHATGMEDIAKAVGMRASSLYNHFHSKQEVLADISITAMEDMLRANAAALAGITGGPRERLAETMRTHIVYHTTQAMRVRVLTAHISSLEEPSHSIVLQARRDYVARWMTVVNEGVTEGIFSAPDVKIACWALIDMGLGVAIGTRQKARIHQSSWARCTPSLPCASWKPPRFRSHFLKNCA